MARPPCAAGLRRGLSFFGQQARPARPAAAPAGICYRARPSSCGRAYTKLILHVDADDLLEARVGPEAELERAAGVEIARPARDDLDDHRIGLAPDERRYLVSCHLAQCRDLVSDGDRHARHG